MHKKVYDDTAAVTHHTKNRYGTVQYGTVRYQHKIKKFNSFIVFKVCTTVPHVVKILHIRKFLRIITYENAHTSIE